MTVAAAENEPSDWSLERRASKGFLVWKKDESKVRFRFEVEVLEYEKDPEELKLMHDDISLLRSSSSLSSSSRFSEFSHTIIICATCIAALAVTLFVPWYLVGST